MEKHPRNCLQEGDAHETDSNPWPVSVQAKALNRETQKALVLLLDAHDYAQDSSAKKIGNLPWSYRPF